MSDRGGLRAGPRSASGRSRLPAVARLAIWTSLGVLTAIALAGSMVYTERSSFCPTCHEMRPYYNAWQKGAHASDAECVDCHVDPGLVAHAAHKPTALKEVWNHFFADNRFPTYGVDVPNTRCERCHQKVRASTESKFSHAEHAKQATCQACHASSAHAVTFAALRVEGVLRAAATTPPVPGGLSPSRIPSHEAVVCQQCHDQSRMRCSECHQAPHEANGECSDCHRPGSAFRFVHGGTGGACSECHTAPANHFGAGCSTCHSPDVPFDRATFRHPSRIGEHNYRSFACVKCHPKSFASSSCTCHGGKPPSDD